MRAKNEKIKIRMVTISMRAKYRDYALSAGIGLEWEGGGREWAGKGAVGWV